jgi:hypothetical protein
MLTSVNSKLSVKDFSGSIWQNGAKSLIFAILKMAA